MGLSLGKNNNNLSSNPNFTAPALHAWVGGAMQAAQQ
jgi:hypothetical protein